MLERKKLTHVKEQMLALLVISRNFRGRLAASPRRTSPRGHHPHAGFGNSGGRPSCGDGSGRR